MNYKLLGVRRISSPWKRVFFAFDDESAIQYVNDAIRASNLLPFISLHEARVLKLCQVDDSGRVVRVVENAFRDIIIDLECGDDVQNSIFKA